MTGTTASKLTDATNRLSEVLKRETRILRTMRPHEIQTLRQEKEIAANLYLGLMSELKEEADSAKLGGPDLTALRQAAQNLHTATEANAVALEAAIHANQRFGESVANAVRGQMAASATYGRDGRLGSPTRKTGAPVTFNQSL